VPVPVNGSASSLRLLCVLVEDRPGILQRVTNCVGRRGHRLVSCAVAEGPEAGALRLWLRVDTETQPPEQAALQLRKLIDVVAVEDLTETGVKEWSLGLFEFRPPFARDLESELGRRGAQLVERSPERLVAALSGPPAALDTAQTALAALGLSDFARSRPIALQPAMPQEA
jgi:acetolactate synthase-1/3 small subunit